MQYTTIPMTPYYSINTDGEVYSSYVNRKLASYVNNKGYECIKLFINGKTKTLLISRLLAHTFLNLYDLWDIEVHVDHIDRNPANNNLSNLQVLHKKDHYIKTSLDNNVCKIELRCTQCGVLLSRGNKSQLCLKHVNREIVSIDISEIEYWVTNYSWVRAGKELGLSDTALRKKYKKITGKDPKHLTKLKRV